MYLDSVPFLIYTDYYNLQNFGTKVLLIRQQARWAGLLPQYKYHIQFRPGEANGKADAFTGRSGDPPKEGDMCGRPIQVFLDPTKFSGFSNPVPCNTAITTTQTSELHLQKMSWQLKLQKHWTLERNNLLESIPARCNERVHGRPGLRLDSRD